MEKQTEDTFLALSSDECAHSGGYPDSDEDIITSFHVPNLDMLQRSVNLPIISVTPHSPAGRVYSVLEENLQQLREIHENVQQMRNITMQDPYCGDFRDFVFAINPAASPTLRVSSSCPSLNEVSPDFDVLIGAIGSSSLHRTSSRKRYEVQDWLCQPDTQRRMSWSAVEDLSVNEKMKFYRQRSISLSSNDSEVDESLLDNTESGTACNLLDTAVVTQRTSRVSGSATSTHSLNEADLQIDFNIIKSKRATEQTLITQRLPLQKSISTPSILAVRDLVPEPVLTGIKSIATPTTFEEHGEKRRKRGSLFFRKKKDKSKKSSHQWVSACYSTSYTCDICDKPLSTKSALYCDCCGITVHQNSCKDNALECVKTKGTKNNVKTSGVGISNSRNYHTKRGSITYPDGNNHQNTSQNQIFCDERDGDIRHGHCEITSFADDIPLIPSEFLSDAPLTAGDLCSDIDLGLHENEPDSWTPRVGKDLARKLKEKEVKRQEHIYEFILTEKHHCITLLVMKKIFVEGLQKYFQLGTGLDRMFPRLTDLIELHLEFLSHLRQRQRENAVVSTIADILEEQFSNQNALKLKSCYGEFCSKHRDAVEIYKDYLHNDPRFEQFVRHCQCNPLLKKKGIPECILFITQRLTKYPLLIEPLIKTSKDNKPEQEALQRTLHLVKDILIDVDAQVAEKEKEDRKLEIYNKIDPKSYTMHKGLKFKKSDILQSKRSLKFEGVAMLMQGRSKMQLVLVIIFSDILLFLQETSQKYVFFNPDNKAGVVSLQKLLVREKAGQDSRGIYLISSNPAYPEMFELKVHKPKDKQVWINAIREAVQSCPENDDDGVLLNVEDNQALNAPRQTQIRHLVGLLRQKDVEQALLFEEKLTLQMKLMCSSGLDPPSPPTYRHLVSENVDSGQTWKEVFTAIQEVSRLVTSLYTTGTTLSRSVSSVGEHQSEAYISPIIPKRAETFGGFDSCNQISFKLPEKKIGSNSALGEISCSEEPKSTDTFLQEKLLQKTEFEVKEYELNTGVFSAGQEQQHIAIQLSHYVYTLLCIISQLMTTNESFQAQINSLKLAGDGARQYRHNQQLEELRNLQDKLSAEKSAWIATRDQEEKELEEKRIELLKLQEQIKSEQNDIEVQREQLFRTMEKLTNKGLIISPNVGILSLSGQIDDVVRTDSEDPPQFECSTNVMSSLSLEKKKDTKWMKNSQTKSQLPINLISATNQQKVSQNVQVKQQIPLKLASRLNSSGTSTSGVTTTQLLPLKLSQDEKSRRVHSSGYQRLSPPSRETTAAVTHFHSRTGSSPATMEITHSNSNESPPSAICTNQISKGGDEEVIYF